MILKLIVLIVNPLRKIGVSGVRYTPDIKDYFDIISLILFFVNYTFFAVWYGFPFFPEDVFRAIFGSLKNSMSPLGSSVLLIPITFIFTGLILER